MKHKDIKVGMWLSAVVDRPQGAQVLKGGVVVVTNVDNVNFIFTSPGTRVEKNWVGSACNFEPYIKAGDTPAPLPAGQAGGLKYDGGKAPWSLLLSAKGMLAAVGGVVNVLGFGAKKYTAYSWREVEDNERRYTDALMRHLVAIQAHGLTAKDEESGELHIDHLNCNGLFLGELARK
jgi:hypothetical protein